MSKRWRASVGGAEVTRWCLEQKCHHGLSLPTGYVLIALAMERDFSTDQVVITQTRLAEMCGISLSSVVRARKELEEAGLVETWQIGQASGHSYLGYKLLGLHVSQTHPHVRETHGHVSQTHGHVRETQFPPPLLHQDSTTTTTSKSPGLINGLTGKPTEEEQSVLNELKDQLHTLENENGSNR